MRRCPLVDMQQYEEQVGDPKDLKDPAEQVLFHLLRHPYDLVDTRRLMRRFHASATDISRALGEFELYALKSTEGPVG